MLCSSVMEMMKMSTMGSTHISDRRMKMMLKTTFVPGLMRLRTLEADFLLMISPPPQIMALCLSTLRTMALATRMVMQPMTDWKKPAAAVRPMGTLGVSSML